MKNFIRVHARFTTIFFTSVLLALLGSYLQPPKLVAIGGGSSEEADVPIPTKNYAVDIVDRSGTQISAQRLSLDGKVYLQGLLGKSEVSIPFEKIARIEVKGNDTKDNDYFDTSIFFKDGKKVQVLVRQRSKVYGDSDFGKFSLYIRDISTITFK